MTREEAKKRAEVMLAFAAGKDVQFFNRMSGQWEDIPGEVLFDSTCEYRVTPEPQYRPFKTQEECWEEMYKHKPFGFIKDTGTQKYNNIVLVYTEENNPYVSICGLSGIASFHADYMFLRYTFADGTPFGIKEE